jgi:molecular chaperone DnaK (HSP70)
MARVSIDFGTANTVTARLSESTGEAETLEIPGITVPFKYRLSPSDPERTVHLAPSMIHYAGSSAPWPRA